MKELISKFNNHQLEHFGYKRYKISGSGDDYEIIKHLQNGGIICCIRRGLTKEKLENLLKTFIKEKSTDFVGLGDPGGIKRF
jgi:hypothetical protein